MPRAIDGSAYALEADLVAHFARVLDGGKTPWGNSRILFEFEHSAGWTDVVILSEKKEVVAFEAKLTRWRDALHQAYRGRCFANRVYVVLPDAIARIAMRHEIDFRRRRVGLCSVTIERGIEVLIDAACAEPSQPWVTAKALDEVESGWEPIWQCRQMKSSRK